MFQISINRYYEYVKFVLVGRYASYILQLFTVSFYAYLVPLGSFAVAIIVFFQF